MENCVVTFSTPSNAENAVETNKIIKPIKNINISKRQLKMLLMWLYKVLDFSLVPYDTSWDLDKRHPAPTVETNKIIKPIKNIKTVENVADVAL